MHIKIARYKRGISLEIAERSTIARGMPETQPGTPSSDGESRAAQSFAIKRKEGKQRARRYRDDAAQLHERLCSSAVALQSAPSPTRENSLYYVRMRRFTTPLRVRSQRNIKEPDDPLFSSARKHLTVDRGFFTIRQS